MAKQSGYTQWFNSLNWLLKRIQNYKEIINANLKWSADPLFLVIFHWLGFPVCQNTSLYFGFQDPFSVLDEMALYLVFVYTSSQRASQTYNMLKQKSINKKRHYAIFLSLLRYTNAKLLEQSILLCGHCDLAVVVSLWWSRSGARGKVMAYKVSLTIWRSFLLNLISDLTNEGCVPCFQIFIMTTENKDRASDALPQILTKRQLLSCGVGSFYNDLVNKVMLSFGLVYYMKVAEISSSHAGLVLVSGQIGNFIGNFLFGYCCDKVDVPFLSRVQGRRKAWHLIGTILTAVCFVLAFSRCFVCTEASPTWVRTVYFAFAYGLGCFWYGAVEVGHLSFIPDVANDQDETITLNSLR